MERVYECARLASISEEIEEMPMQYHTVVGDICAGLSGGQIQRILLAITWISPMNPRSMTR